MTDLPGSDDDLGPISGSREWADSRLARLRRKQGADSGGPGSGDAPDLGAASAEPSPEDIERVIARLIAESVQLAATNGFVTGVGGFVTLPVAISTGGRERRRRQDRDVPPDV